jgi:hypothetical protein
VNVTNPSTLGTGTNPTDTGVFQQQTLFPLDDPNTAFNNAARAQGFNPFAFNPYMSFLRKSAPGLEAAFVQQQAQAPNPAGGWSGAAPSGQSFGNFLTNAISGNGNTGIFGSLQGAAQGMSGAVNAVRQYQEQINNGIPIQNLNPYMGLLQSMYAANNGQGLANNMFLYNAPELSPALASAYGTALTSQAPEAALRNYALGLQPGNAGNRDVWGYLLGQY